ncbi:ribosome small subunit-dependent GTPase A [Rhodococcus sp. 06-412-2C]|uniref:ribosome small subunit-dependent GTPase A n=1 Tax=unclassified Rhodococcus (in: high G+C Gram-positive bacteria) TaxID=192944 RepID=UPI000B9AE9F7|nr:MULTISPECIES: ribosome small subunit-dependent GTPase A [unclassified Rhodococcus (in: high G+C Gram-positive bacteria)]OZC83828.1 ribosome small subunit-dependent GTPase A [Rhodococcus sp. 06-412-2C]OZC94015.1 ribosome small subunit-dependent GTPase A [Rhodococcus sp. 06-412-2B]
MSPLDHYGLDQHWLTEFEKLSQNTLLARVVRVDRGEFDAATDNGIVRCTGSKTCTGDWVTLDEHSFRLIAILPRRTAIERASAGSTSDTQILGANVDTVVVTVASDTALDLGRVERYITLAWGSGAVPVLAITKTDSGGVAEELLTAAAPGVTVCSTSAVSDGGIDSLTPYLRGTVALIGPSGSGKSTLGNALLGGSAFATGATRDADGKGRHTTVHRELVPIPASGLVLLDTPGLRSVGIQGSEDAVASAFSDIEELAALCRFGDCAHEHEPGCAVLAAIESGELTERRVGSYRKLLRENAWATSRHDARARSEKLREYKQISKSLRQKYAVERPKR